MPAVGKASGIAAAGSSGYTLVDFRVVLVKVYHEVDSNDCRQDGRLARIKDGMGALGDDAETDHERRAPRAGELTRRLMADLNAAVAYLRNGRARLDHVIKAQVPMSRCDYDTELTSVTGGAVVSLGYSH